MSTQRDSQSVGNPAEHPISDEVTMGVVDVFEVIPVDYVHRDWLVGARSAAQPVRPGPATQRC